MPFVRLCMTAFAATILFASLPTHANIPWFSGQNGELPTLAPMLEAVTPAVVNISVRARSAYDDNPLLRDPFFRRFFDLPKRSRQRPQPASVGSGVIVNAAQGYVLTNNHVIENADEIVVTLSDRRNFSAALVGRDPATDIAVLKIKPENLTELSLADSDQLRVGDFVIAIGNPFGLGQTVTSGIISALSRSGLNIEGYEDFIQTDASINPGNSGGALVNLRGELVGINTAIIGPGGNIGIGFAVPSNIASTVMNQLTDYGEVRRGRLGVYTQDLTTELARALRIDGNEGAVIIQIIAGSTADKAGLQAGDVIIAINNRPVRNSADLRNRIGLTAIDQDMELTILREGKELTIDTRLGEIKRNYLQGHQLMPQLAGAIFQSINDEGIIVADIQSDSPAARYGLREGDSILAVNRRRVTSLDDFSKRIRASSRVVTINLRRGNTNLFLVIQ